MVNVGYFIDGKHGVIKNCEIHDYSDTMKYIRFEKGNDIYVAHYKDIEYIIPSDIVEENESEGKFDYNISCSITEWYNEGYNECKKSCQVHKSELADTIEDIFEWGGYNVKISCVERKDESKN